MVHISMLVYKVEFRSDGALSDGREHSVISAVNCCCANHLFLRTSVCGIETTEAFSTKVQTCNGAKGKQTGLYQWVGCNYRFYLPKQGW